MTSTKPKKYSIGENVETDNYDVVVDLGDQPWGNDYRPIGESAPNYPLQLLYFHGSELLQLSHFIPKEVMFSNHSYLSGITKSLRDHFKSVAEYNTAKYNFDKSAVIVDIGGNDGTQLLEYKKIGYSNLVNIESATNIAKISTDAGIKTINAFANEKVFKKNFQQESVDLINASGVFFHMEELHSVIRGIVYALKSTGVLNVQFMYAGAMVDNGSFDMIYHEHLCYYTINSISKLLGKYGLKLHDAYISDIHSGSVIATFTKFENKLAQSEETRRVVERDKLYTLESFIEMGKRALEYSAELKRVIEEISQSHSIYTLGAPVKGSTLLNTAKIKYPSILKSHEINALKVGCTIPGTNIPVSIESDEDRPDYYLLLSHNFAKEIISKKKHLQDQGTKFIIPFPVIHII